MDYMVMMTRHARRHFPLRHQAARTGRGYPFTTPDHPHVNDLGLEQLSLFLLVEIARGT